MREGPQPPRCIIESCDNSPAPGGEVYCAGHLKMYANGTAVTPPIVEADDPALSARLAREALEAEGAAQLTPAPDPYRPHGALPRDAFGVEYVPIPPDPIKEAARNFKRALRGKYGPATQKLAEALAEHLEER